MIALFADWTWIDWTVVITGLLYVWFAAWGKRICWLFGIVSCALIAHQDFIRLRLYSDGILQLIYVLMGIIGWFNWKAQSPASAISTWPFHFHVKLIGISVLLTLPLGWCFQTYTAAAFPWMDAWTTLLSLAATWMTVRRILENWLYWIIADLIYIYLYSQQGAGPFSILFVVYTLIAIYGWFSWQNMHRRAHAI